MRIIATSMAILVGGAGWAQDLQFDISDTLACMDRAATYQELENCIGQSAQACMEANSVGSTTYGMSGCMDQELSFWDDRLNQNYRALRSEEKQQDAEMEGLPGAVNQANALRDMQRAWITFRDATCDYERAQWGGGTGGGPATVGCLLDLTGKQALYLKQMMDNY